MPLVVVGKVAEMIEIRQIFMLELLVKLNLKFNLELINRRGCR